MTTKHYDELVFEPQFRKFLKDLSGWTCMPAQDRNRPQAFAPPDGTPYITVLQMDMWHLGIPYRKVVEVFENGESQGHQQLIVAHAMSLYSVKFIGEGAFIKSQEVSVLVRGNSAFLLNSNIPEAGRTYRRHFYIHECGNAKNLTQVVNGCLLYTSPSPRDS